MQKGAQGRRQKDCKVKKCLCQDHHTQNRGLDGKSMEPPRSCYTGRQGFPNFPSCIASMRNGEVISTWLGDLTNYERCQTLTPVAHQTARASPGPTRSSEHRLLCSASPRYFQLQSKKNDLPVCKPKISHCLRVCVLWAKDSNPHLCSPYLLA